MLVVLRKILSNQTCDENLEGMHKQNNLWAKFYLSWQGGDTEYKHENNTYNCDFWCKLDI